VLEWVGLEGVVGLRGVVVGCGCGESERLCFPCLLFLINVRDADVPTLRINTHWTLQN